MEVYCNVSYSPRKGDGGWQIPGGHSFEDKRESGNQLLGSQPRGGKVEDGGRGAGFWNHVSYWILFISLSSLKNSRGHWNLYLDEVGGGKFTNAVSISAQFTHSVVSDSLQPHWLQHARLPCPLITNSWSLLKLMSTEPVIPSNSFILLLSVFPSIRVFSNELFFCIRWPKYWSFRFNISPFNEYLGLLSFRIDWLHILAVEGTLKSLLQHHSSKVSILQHSAFFMVQLSHPYMTTGKTIALTRWTFAGKVMFCFLIWCRGWA